MWYVNIIELVLFMFFLFLAYGPYIFGVEFEIINIFYAAGFIIILFVSIINHFSEKQQTGSYKGHILGYLLAALFMGSNVLFARLEISIILNIIMLVVLAGVFIMVFLITFIYLEE